LEPSTELAPESAADDANMCGGRAVTGKSGLGKPERLAMSPLPSAPEDAHGAQRVERNNRSR
jgi:hypothetical protein